LICENLKYQIKKHIGRLTLDRPPVNALSAAMVDELSDAAEQIVRDVAAQRIRCLIIDAVGKVFCAGADLKERVAFSDSQVALAVKMIGEMVKRFAELPVPVIAAIQGSAIGGGFELALAADIRVMAETAAVGLRETALAIIPGAGGTQRLSRLVGSSTAFEWIATARLYSGEEALRAGAVNHVVDGADLLEKSMSIAQQIAANAPSAVRLAKEAIRCGEGMPLDEALDIEFRCYEKLIDTEDRKEGLQAFKEKRAARFKGR
jgi:enoyl-CoA hydratase/carnithine racemase